MASKKMSGISHKLMSEYGEAPEEARSVQEISKETGLTTDSINSKLLSMYRRGEIKRAKVRRNGGKPIFVYWEN